MSLQSTQHSNYTIRVGLIHLPPEMELYGSDDNITLGGYFGEFFSIFFTLVNTSYEYVRIPDNKLGSMNKNKTWSGMMKYLVENKIQVGASLTQTRKRQEYVKFSPILYSSSYRLLYRELESSEWSYDFFLEPFHADVWICVLLFSGVIILLANIYKRKISLKTPYLKTICNFIHDIIYHLILCWPVVFLSAHNISVNNASSRIIFLCYYLFAVVTIVSYNTQLTAMLTVARYTIPFQSLEDMILETEYFPVIVQGRSIEEMFSNAEEEPWKSGWEKIMQNQPTSMVNTTLEGIDTVYSTKSAFITTLENVQTITKNCSFNFAPGFFGKLTDSIAYSLDFPHTETFNQRIIQMGEAGILYKLARRYYIGETLCSTSGTLKPVKLQSIVSIVLVCTAGLMLSLIICLVEILVSKIFDNRLQNL